MPFMPMRRRAIAYSAIAFYLSVVDELITRFRTEYLIDLKPHRREQSVKRQNADALRSLPPIKFQSREEYDQTVRETVGRHLDTFRRYSPEGSQIQNQDGQIAFVMIQSLVLADLLARSISFSEERNRYHLSPEQVASGQFDSMNGFLYMVETMTDGGRRDRVVMLTKGQFQMLCSACPGRHRNEKMEALSKALIASLGPDAPCDLALISVEELPSLVNLHLRFQSSMLEAAS